MHLGSLTQYKHLQSQPRGFLIWKCSIQTWQATCCPACSLSLLAPRAWSCTLRNSSVLCSAPRPQPTHPWGLSSALTKDVGFLLRCKVSLCLEKALFPTFRCGQSKGYNYLPVPKYLKRYSYTLWDGVSGTSTSEESDLGNLFKLTALSVSWHEQAPLPPPPSLHSFPHAPNPWHPSLYRPSTHRLFYSWR